MGSAGWGDAATIIPWDLYMAYGDVTFLSQQYESMKAWVGYMEKESGENFLWQSGFHFGDWLYYNEPVNASARPGFTDKDLLATAFFARSTWILWQTATVLKMNQMRLNSKDFLKTFGQPFSPNS